MKRTQSSDTRLYHPTVARIFEFKSNDRTIAIGFTDQRLSTMSAAPVPGLAATAGPMPIIDRGPMHPLSTSNNQILPLEKTLAFMHGLWCDARKLAQVAYLRRDPLVPELLGIRRVASQSVLMRFFQECASASGNRRGFGPPWHGEMNQLSSRKEGCPQDLDSPRLLHKDGQQEGVAGGYTKQGIKRCLHPLQAMFADVRLGHNCGCAPAHLLRQQRNRLLHGSVGKPALCGGGTLEPANHSGRSSVDADRSPRHGSG